MGSVALWLVVIANTVLAGLAFAYMADLRGEVTRAVTALHKALAHDMLVLGETMRGALVDPEKRFKLSRIVDAHEVSVRRRQLLAGARK